jgi:fermentation-respiration switch protein FrsA (DUF1100 family)
VSDAMSHLEWFKEETSAGCVERSFLLRRRSGTVPGVMWSPGTPAARAVSAPVLYHVQWDDTIFPREGQFELFGALASPDKRLFARSGPHAETHPDDEASWQEFIRLNTSGACSH